MLCVLCLIVLWGFSLVTSFSGVKVDMMDSASTLGGGDRPLRGAPQ